MRYALLYLAVACCAHLGLAQRKWGVYLTVSSVVHGKRLRLLELNWHDLPENLQRGTSVHLLDKDPSRTPLQPLESYAVSGPGGTRVTNVSFPRLNWLTDLTTDACLGYWVVLSSRPDEVLASSCLRARPRWMQQHCQQIGHMTFRSLFIPGTHNSGMYDLTSPDQVSLIDSFLQNQDESIANQLAFGIRSLDLRVQENRGEFWITHDLLRGQQTVRDVLQQVRRFVVATGEPVLLDFHRFTVGFGSRDPNPQQNHVKLVELIVSELGDLLLYSNATRLPLADILGRCQPRGSATRRTVIVCYNHPYEGPGSEYLSPGVKQLWANAGDIESLKGFLEERICRSFPAPTSAMVQMTAQFPNLLVSNRKLAQRVAWKATGWFRDEWWECANLVAMDFFLGNNMIDVAIEANLRRSSH